MLCPILVFALQLAASGATLVHRYSFTSNANDSVDTANGALQGSTHLDGDPVVLTGSNHAASHVRLPGSLASRLPAMTIGTDLGTVADSDATNMLTVTPDPREGNVFSDYSVLESINL